MAQLLQELRQEIGALLDKILHLIALKLLTGHGRNHQAWIPGVQHVSQEQELSVAPLNIYGAEIVASFDIIHCELLTGFLLEFVTINLQIKIAVVGLDIFNKSKPSALLIVILVPVRIILLEIELLPEFGVLLLE